MNRKLEEWNFNFGLYAPAEGKLVREEQAEELMNEIVKFAEKKGLCVGGGYGEFPDDPKD